MTNITNDTQFGMIQQTLQKLRDIFSRQRKIKKAIIYGSRAKGNFTAGSDIDVTVIAPEMTFSEYLILLSEIEELDIPQKIDLTKYELLEDNIKEHIKRVGKEIYERDEL
ncbi:nucleotidyltransferase domain-containing protein [Thermodesulfovibrio sp. TK110]